jgi:hypothetical protein
VQLTIANLNLEITSQDLPIIQDENPAYIHFLSTEKVPGTEPVKVQLWTDRRMPPVSSLTKIFDTSESWQLYSDTQNRYIRFQPEGAHGEPLWSACINAGLREVDIYCSNALIKQLPGHKVILNPVQYPLDQILLINLLVGKGLLIHTAGIVINGKGYLFAGPSGAGKSTLTRFFKGSQNNIILSDDRIVVQKMGNDFFMYGTPWPGEEGIAVNDSAKLHGMFFLKQSNENKIRKLSISETLEYFFKVSSLPLYDKSDLQKSLDFCEELLEEVKTYELSFRPDTEIVEKILSFIAD